MTKGEKYHFPKRIKGTRSFIPVMFNHERQCWVYNLKKDELGSCRTFATNRDALVAKRNNGNSNTWKKRSTLIGVMGEFTVSKFLDLGLAPCYSFSEERFDYGGRNLPRLEVKTRAGIYVGKVETYGWIKAITANNIMLDQNSDMFVFASAELDSKGEPTGKVVLAGFLPRSYVIGCPIEDSRREDSGHKNYEVPYSKLTEIARLLDYYK